MSYVDGYVLPVPTKHMETYRAMARKAGKVWMEHGALSYCECLAEDVKPGKWTSFPQAVKLKEGETVIFAWVVYKSRRDRDAINAKVMKDPRLANMKDMPVDGKRMFWGGFTPIVTLGGAPTALPDAKPAKAAAKKAAPKKTAAAPPKPAKKKAASS